MDLSKDKTSWQDKRVFAMNRVIKRKGLSTLNYLDEYERVTNSKAKNKKEYKKHFRGRE
jgi:hypothetical protein